MYGKLMRPRRLSATAYAAVVIATSLGSAAAAETQENHAIESIDRYCRTSWRNARIDQQDWEECTQQTFVELLDRVSRDRWNEAIQNRHSSERRELNRSIWRVAQRWRRAPRMRNGVAEHLAEAPTSDPPNEDPGLDEVLQKLTDRDTGLSPRQKDVIQRWIDGNSIAEIADDLDLPPARISDEKYKAIRKLRSALSVG